ncbi:MAG: hypothetical protein QXY09_05475 [Acidilobaceae archaeon]
MLRVYVEDFYIVPVKPKMTKTVLQYVILCKDEREYAQVFFIDADKYDKNKFIDLVKEEYSKKYRIAKDDVEVVFLVELPRVSSS